MKQVTCARCSATAPLGKTFVSGGETYCGACAETVASEANASGQPATFARNLDASVCALCGKDNPSGADFVFRKKLPFCETCGPKVEKWPYPQWLKLSLAALVLLLAVSLIRGRTYFHAGRELYVGERLVKNLKYADAIPHLKEAVRIAPLSDKAVLLLAKASLKAGDTATAAAALDGHNSGNFENGQDSDFLEVKALWDRAEEAIKKANHAIDLLQQDGKEVEAAKLMHAAAAQYPESKVLAGELIHFDEGAAFAEKNYDQYLALAQQDSKKDSSAISEATVASAWACKYAVSGNPQFKQEAEQALERARQMAGNNADETKALEEYEPRIRYRIETRQIISRQEYDKRFRSNQKEKAAK